MSSKNAELATNLVQVSEHIVEVVSDSGEGAQTCGQLFGTISAKMGNGIWTVEIIPAEIEPPARSRAGASGNRVRIGSNQVTNLGDEADVVIAFNEQVLYSRIDVGAFKEGTRIFLDSKWATSPDETIQKEYSDALADFAQRGYEIIEVPVEQECLKHVSDPRRGKNIWALGLLCAIYDRDLEVATREIHTKLIKKGQDIVDKNITLLRSGYDWAVANIATRYNVPATMDDTPRVVMNGNTAAALGAMGAGFEICSMYPITPATSVSHYLAASFHKVGGFVHQAEDEIAAIGFAIGVSYAGKTALTVTSGPGLALKTEFIGLAVMAEIPLVIWVVQRGGPSTGLPTKVEQGDLLASLYGEPGDTPKIIIAPSTIEDCYHDMILARELAEEYRTPVIVLSDANLATGQQSYKRPEVKADSMSAPLDQSAWEPGKPAYDWDPDSGISERPIPGRRGGEYVLTGLGHDERSLVAYDSDINQKTMESRSRKFVTLQKKLPAPEIFGADEGDLLVVGWGSTKGAIDEAVSRLQADGKKVSSMNLRFLFPFPIGLTDVFKKFKKVMTVEINYSDDIKDPYFAGDSRRYAQLAMYLRGMTLADIDCWSLVPGSPLPPGMIEKVLRERL